VIVTKKDRAAARVSDDGMASETVLSDVRVLAIDQMLEEKNGQQVVIGKTATLELTPPQADTPRAADDRIGDLRVGDQNVFDLGGQIDRDCRRRAE
jgi:pilus assembly protein CpaB